MKSFVRVHMSVCVSARVGVQYVPDDFLCVCACVCACACDIWSGCHAYGTFCINCGDKIMDLEDLCVMMFEPASVKLYL